MGIVAALLAVVLAVVVGTSGAPGAEGATPPTLQDPPSFDTPDAPERVSLDASAPEARPQEDVLLTNQAVMELELPGADLSEFSSSWLGSSQSNFRQWGEASEVFASQFLTNQDGLAALSDGDLVRHAFGVASALTPEEALTALLRRRGLRVAEDIDLSVAASLALERLGPIADAARAIEIAKLGALNNALKNGRYDRFPLKTVQSLRVHSLPSEGDLGMHFWAGEGWIVQTTLNRTDVPGIDEMSDHLNSEAASWASSLQMDGIAVKP